MCGIFGLLNNNDKINKDIIEKYFNYGKKRGPEYSKLKMIQYPNVYFGFHRLAINGLDQISNQPFHIDNFSLICNGEIYNYKELFNNFGIESTTNSDCEVILHLYKKCGVKCFDMLDGVFACIIYDHRKNEIIIARDPYGVRPLYICYYTNGNIGLCSDIKPLTFDEIKHIQQFEPGNYGIFKKVLFMKDNSHDYELVKQERYFFNTSLSIPIHEKEKPIEYYMYYSLELLKKAIHKRVHNCEREVACLLSGGLDSSIVSAYVSRYYKEKTGKLIETYSIGLPGAEDMNYANKVSTHIGSKHINHVVSNEFFLISIPSVISDVETYDTTTVRASVGNWNIGKYIKENSKAKVIFNGDGADELMGGYMYFHCAPDDQSFHEETLKLLKDICHYDVLRSDKSISSHGLEPRTPFLDKEFTKFYLSIPIKYRNHNNLEKCEKYLIRQAIENYEPDLLPPDILWRKKEAFSDGVSSMNKSWYEIIHEYLSNMINNEDHVELDDKLDDKLNLYPKTVEQKCYYELYHKNITNPSFNITPYYWMPNFIEDAYDASARTLNIYKNKIK